MICIGPFDVLIVCCVNLLVNVVSVLFLVVKCVLLTRNGIIVQSPSATIPVLSLTQVVRIVLIVRGVLSSVSVDYLGRSNGVFWCRNLWFTLLLRTIASVMFTRPLSTRPRKQSIIRAKSTITQHVLPSQL